MKDKINAWFVGGAMGGILGVAAEKLIEAASHNRNDVLLAFIVAVFAGAGARYAEQKINNQRVSVTR